MTSWSRQAARERVYEVFVAGWASRTPLQLDNQAAFVPPAPTLAPAAPAAWARLAVRHLSSTQETIGQVGNRKWARIAVAVVQLFVQVGAATEAIDILTDAASDLLEGADLGDLHVFMVDTNEIGVTPTGWYQVNVNARFRYSQIH